MDKRDLTRIRHIVDSIHAILEYVKGKKKKDFDESRMLLQAVVREIEIIGEAANALSLETKNLFPNVPWKDIIAMRNRLIHAYFDIDHNLVWVTVSNDLPILLAELNKSFD